MSPSPRSPTQSTAKRPVKIITYADDQVPDEAIRGMRESRADRAVMSPHDHECYELTVWLSGAGFHDPPEGAPRSSGMTGWMLWYGKSDRLLTYPILAVFFDFRRYFVASAARLSRPEHAVQQALELGDKLPATHRAAGRFPCSVTRCARPRHLHFRAPAHASENPPPQRGGNERNA